MSAPQLQWDLSRSVDSTFAVTQGIIRAATTDNVQILALLACERFGATLVVSPGTCRKVESEVIKMQTPSARVLTFLNATIGYSRDDCTSHLARSQAGIQFIALAATLIPSLSAFDGATALSIMLKESAADKTLVPPVSQLKYLLLSLEHRCVRLGFSNHVFGWTRLLYKPSITSATFIGEIPTGCYLDRMSHVPSPDFIGKLVGALRQLSGTRDARSGITIRIDSGVAWIAAFIQWCIGIPPSVYLDDGTALFEGPPSKVDIIFCTVSPNSEPQGITGHSNLGRPSELIASYEGDKEWPRKWTGMLPVESYGRWLLRELDLDKGVVLGVVNEVLPYVMKQITALLRPSDTYLGPYTTEPLPGNRFQALPAEENIAKLCLNPWPRDHAIAAILSRMLNSNGPENLLEIPKGTSVMDLPLLKECFPKDVEGQCRCLGCIPTEESSDDETRECQRKAFVQNLSIYAFNVLLLSLFQFSENLLIDANQACKSRHEIVSILETGQSVSCHYSYILKAALVLLGHDLLRRAEATQWMISCYRGQAVYPRLFETQNPYESGYLTLCWAPGLLRHEQETYSLGIGSTEYVDFRQSNKNMEQKEIVTMSRNMFFGYNTIWRVAAGDDVLVLDFGIENSGADQKYSMTSPVLTLTGLVSTLIPRRCSHPANAQLPKPDPFAIYNTFPSGFTTPYLGEDPRTISVIPVDGNDRLRLYALASYASYGPLVLRKETCLACCLAFARKVNSRVVIC